MTTATTERRYVPQHLKALARANEVRLHQSNVKRKVRDGDLSIEEALEDPGIGSMAIADLLRAQRRWGYGRVRQLLRRVEISENRRIDALTPRQVELIVRVLTRGW